ncbi:MAG: hypothetical protein KC457_05190, partial [Myxococcales bacterium]|nr:hypothetical protein [Myxococcales bacterium]
SCSSPSPPVRVAVESAAAADNPRMPIRFQHGGAYDSDVDRLRNQTRANGTNVNIAAVVLTHPNTASQVTFHVNLAFEANSNLQPVDASLYTVAVGNTNGTWRFNIANFPWGGLAGSPMFPGAPDGSYASLGYNNNNHAITSGDLQQALDNVANYAGAGPVPGGVETGIARLIIAVNEAVRSNTIKGGIGGVLGNNGGYVPDWNRIHNWGGHVLG